MSAESLAEIVGKEIVGNNHADCDVVDVQLERGVLIDPHVDPPVHFLCTVDSAMTRVPIDYGTYRFPVVKFDVKIVPRRPL